MLIQHLSAPIPEALPYLQPLIKARGDLPSSPLLAAVQVLSDRVEAMAPEEICAQKEAMKALSASVSELSSKPGSRTSYHMTTYYNTEEASSEPRTDLQKAAFGIWEALSGTHWA